MHPTRRHFLGVATVAVAATAAAASRVSAAAPSPAQAGAAALVRPPDIRRLLFGVKLSMIARVADGRELTLPDRLRLAQKAGFDGVDFDEAGRFSEQQARDAVRETGVFVHNAINHDHWKMRLTSGNAEERATGRANLEHCLRVSHAAGGSGVLLVVGQGTDGPADVIEERARQEIRAVLPLAAALGQKVLIENVWNRMMYQHDEPPEQGAEPFARFVDSFQSPWVGMYYDIGNHWKYGQPGEWLRTFGHRCVKLDVKGFSRKTGKFVDITSPEDDLPWGQVRRGLDDIGYHGWATAEVEGGGLERLTLVRQQMQKAFARG